MKRCTFAVLVDQLAAAELPKGLGGTDRSARASVRPRRYAFSANLHATRLAETAKSYPLATR
jgi:hypothetical protein